MENNRRLLTGDDINIILDEAIRVGMLHNEDGTEVSKNEITAEDREWLMMAFLEFLIVTGSEKISKFIVAKA
ncbi:uncharacterized protein METZ01_LOCUS101573 [marine metagenome]|uniref:Uncharacterized protein n=1 Tax=marine metagenome TaxID=408172 RepID=A0A381W845_9ZZZZ